MRKITILLLLMVAITKGFAQENRIADNPAGTGLIMQSVASKKSGSKEYSFMIVNSGSEKMSREIYLSLKKQLNLIMEFGEASFENGNLLFKAISLTKPNENQFENICAKSGIDYIRMKDRVKVISKNK